MLIQKKLQKKEDKPDWKAEMKGEKVEKVRGLFGFLNETSEGNGDVSIS